MFVKLHSKKEGALYKDILKENEERGFFEDLYINLDTITGVFIRATETGKPFNVDIYFSGESSITSLSSINYDLDSFRRALDCNTEVYG